MHALDLPAGSPIRLTATARSTIGVHRWDVRVVTRADGAPRLAYGSEIGGRDCQQGVDIPAQDADCRLVVWARHNTPAGWEDDLFQGEGVQRTSQALPRNVPGDPPFLQVQVAAPAHSEPRDPSSHPDQLGQRARRQHLPC